jgi:hypothetical protein
MSEWQPIETAPKDGTTVLAYGLAYAELSNDGFSWITADDQKPRKPLVTIIRWHEAWYDKDVEVGDGLFRKEPTLSHAYWKPHAHAFRPTHWQPLPDPPATP